MQSGFPVLPNVDQFFVENFTCELVERTEGFVEQEDIGIAHQRARERGTLLHSARELVWIGIDEVAELNHAEQPSGPGMVGLIDNAAAKLYFHRQQHVIECRPPRQET